MLVKSIFFWLRKRELISIQKRILGEKNQENSFNELKNKLIASPILMHYNKDADTILVTDSSLFGLSVILN